MTREELEALGMTKEQINGTLDMYHKEHDPVQKELDTVKADLAAAQEKVKTHEGTIKGLKKDLEEFKDADVSGMKQKTKIWKRILRQRMPIISSRLRTGISTTFSRTALTPLTERMQKPLRHFWM